MRDVVTCILVVDTAARDHVYLDTITQFVLKLLMIYSLAVAILLNVNALHLFPTCAVR
jgi:hypothetical protein